MSRHTLQMGLAHADSPEVLLLQGDETLINTSGPHVHSFQVVVRKQGCAAILADRAVLVEEVSVSKFEGTLATTPAIEVAS